MRPLPIRLFVSGGILALAFLAGCNRSDSTCTGSGSCTSLAPTAPDLPQSSDAVHQRSNPTPSQQGSGGGAGLPKPGTSVNRRATAVRPAFDAFATRPPSPQVADDLRKGTSLLVKPGSETRVEKRLGVPTFLWASEHARSLVRASSDPAAVATQALEVFGPLYRFDAADRQSARVRSVHDTGRGAVVVKLHQEIEGVEVFRTEMNLILDRQLSPVALSGYLSPQARARLRGGFALAPEVAVASAVGDLGGASISPVDLVESGPARGAYRSFKQASARSAFAPMRLARPARVKQVLFDMIDRLEPAYYVEASLSRRGSVDSSDFAYVYSAIDGRMLSRKNLTAAEVYAYRVWAEPSVDRGFTPFDGPQGTTYSPHPTGVPDGFQPPSYASRNDVAIESLGPVTDPWLPPASTETVGNNADAYLDIFPDDGYQPAAGDFRGAVNPGTNEFFYAYDLDLDPTLPEQRQAAVTHMFYTANWLHDWLYAAGFGEAAGNAQASNYGRGGEEGDVLKVEGQDYSYFDNADCMTPADGESPRIQMYMWHGYTANQLVSVNTDPLPPAMMPAYYAALVPDVGPKSFSVTGDLVMADPIDGCSVLVNAADVAGKIAVLQWYFFAPGCPLNQAVQAAEDAGAIGALVAGYAYAIPAGFPNSVTIPALFVWDFDVTPGITDALASGPVNVTMTRDSLNDHDGTIDSGIFTHEFMHYVSNRLVGNGSGLGTIMAGGLGEGWSDFGALLLALRPEDASNSANVGWTGAFATGPFAVAGLYVDPRDEYYYGVRRVPYSIDFAKNALTFKHIDDRFPLPEGVPTSWIIAAPWNSEVHNSGEVWATMLWECHAALLNDASRLTFDEAQLRMRDYLVASLAATPVVPTLLEARDALLAVAAASDPTNLVDYRLFGRAFARRGAGVGAQAPDRFSMNNVGVVESFDWGNGVSLSNLSLSDDVAWCDHDGLLDNGERGNLTFTVKNVGNDVVSATVVTVTSDNRSVSFPAGSRVELPSLAVGESVTRTIEVALDGMIGAGQVVFQLQASDPSALYSAHASLTAEVNVDSIPSSSATDTFESPAVDQAWTFGRDPSTNPTLPGFSRAGGLGAHYLYGPDLATTADIWAITPPLDVLDDGSSLVLTMQHRFDFEPYDTFYGWDVGLIELTTDDGATWTDVGGPLYNGASIYTGQPAFARTNAAFPARELLTLDLGTGYAAQTVRFRFRVISDMSVGYTGWEIDDLNVAGISNTPFATAVPDRELCVNRRPIARAQAPTQANERSVVTLDGSRSSDADGDGLTYAWTQTQGRTVTLDTTDPVSPTFTALEVGPAGEVLGFDLVVTDTQSQVSVPAHVTLSIVDVNRAPTANAGSAQTVDERGVQVLLDGSASSDPDGDRLTYTWTQVGAPAVTLSDAHATRPTFVTPEVTADTDLTFSLTVNDGSADSAVPSTVTVTVVNVNRAPIANAGAPQTASERGATVTLDGRTSSDPDGDALIYTWTQVGTPTVALTGADSAQPTFATPEVPADTAFTFSLTVSDGTLTSAASTVVVTVTNANRAPTANAGSPQTVPERGYLVLLNGSASSDPDGEALAYSWTQEGTPAVTLSDVHAARPTFLTPEVTGNADLVFSLTVSDGTATSEASTVTVTVVNVNRAPIADAGSAQTADERGVTVTLDGSQSSDPDGDGLAYTWTQVGTPAVTLSDVHAPQPTFVTPDVPVDTALTFSLTVSDGSASSAASTVIVTVTNVNRAPTADAGSAQILGDDGTLVSLDGSQSSDPDGDALTYTWTQTAGPTVVLNDESAVRPVFTAPAVTLQTVLTFSLTVSDGAFTSTDTVNVTVDHVNQAPTAHAGSSQQVSERGVTVTLDGTNSTDPEADALTFSWTQVGGPAVTLSDAHAAQPTFTTPEVAADTTFAFQLVVNDGQLDSAPALVQVTVSNVNRPPTALAFAPASVKGGETVTLDGRGSSDPDGDALTYAWSQTGGALVTLSDSTAVAPTFDAFPALAQPAELTFTLRVVDSGGLSAETTVTVTIAARVVEGSGGCGCGSAGADPSALLGACAFALALARRRRR